jgi:LacI family transcriptional regulator
MKKTKKPVTLVEIAEFLGVSTATVSLALRDKEGVAAKTRDKVHKAVKKLGYVYNRSAARLRTHRSFTIGLVVPNLLNPFFTELTNSVEEQLEAAGWSLLLAKTSENMSRQERALRTMMEYGVDGLLLCPVPSTGADDLKGIVDSKIPLTIFTRPAEGIDADYIGADNFYGSKLATEYLIRGGHKKIAFIGGLPDSVTRKERLSGFLRALKDGGISARKELAVEGDTSLDGGYGGIKKLLGIKDPPTAAVCFNDVVAFGVILGLWAAQITPGKNFSVIGFDNISDSALWSPPLTTVSTPPQQIGKEAVRLLLERIESPRKVKEKVVLPPVLIVRGSCG